MTSAQQSLLDRLKDESKNSHTINALLQIIRELLRGDQAPWTPFQKTELHIDYNDPKIQQDMRQAMKAFKLTREEVLAHYENTKLDQVYLNSRYQVNIRDCKFEHWSVGPRMKHLSIKRLDKGTFISWRDKQRIKNELVGEECEAVELFPAERRLTDTANQFHLWVIAEDGYIFPFGFNQGRNVNYDTSLGNSVQDPLEA